MSTPCIQADRLDRLQSGVSAELKEIKDDMKHVLKILNGNGVPGLVAKVDANCSWISRQIENSSGTTTFIFRAFLAIILSFIAAKVGLTK